MSLPISKTNERLIEKIRTNDHLYNTKSIHYNDHQLKTETWEKIANELKLSVQECKSSWIRLRNCFVNAIKRRHILKHGKKRHLAPWKYEDKMSFLLPFIENRGSLVNYNRLREELLGNPSGDDQHEDSHEVEQLKKTKDIQLVYGNESDLDESDLFYLSMSRIAKRLPKMEQAKLRLKICTIVSEFEMDVIENQEGISMSFVDDASNLIAVKTEIDSDICTRTGGTY